MKKEKHYNISRNQNNIDIDLSDLSLKLVHQDLVNKKGMVPFEIDHVITSNGTKLNIECKLEGEVLTLADGKKITFNERYYYVNEDGFKVYKKENGEYISKSDIVIKDDQSLSYNDKEIIIDVKSEDGLNLRRGYEGFSNSHEFELNDENIVEAKNQINSIKMNINNLTLTKKEYEKELSTEYKNMISNQNDYEEAAYLLENISVTQYDANKTNQQAYKTAKQNYIDYNHREYREIGALRENSGLVEFNETGQRFCADYNLEKSYYMYGSKVTAAEFGTIENIDKARQCYFSELYQDRLNEKSQPVSELSFELEKISITNQDTLNELKKMMLAKQREYLDYKNNMNDNNDELLQELILLINEQLDYYQKSLKLKEYELSQLIKLTPVAFVYKDNSYVLGFNEYGYLCMIFDSYDNRIMVEYDEENKVNYIIDNNENVIRFKYENGLLKRITDMEDRITLFKYNNNDMLTEIIYPNKDSVKYEYTDNLLTKVIDISGTALKIVYSSGIISGLCKVSNDNVPTEKTIASFERINNETIVTDSKTGYKTHYLFYNGSLESEYTLYNEELIETINYEYDSDICKFIVKANKNSEVLFEDGGTSFEGTDSYQMDSEDIYKFKSTDYVALAILKADSYVVNDRRKTNYCNHQTENMSDVRFDIECEVVYDDSTDLFIGTANYENRDYQIVSVPVSLREDINGKVIRPISVSINIRYDNNRDECEIKKIALLKADFIHQQLDYNKNVICKETSDVVTPKIENGVKTGYYISKSRVDNTYDETLLVRRKTTITYEEYDNNDNWIKNDSKEYSIGYTYNKNGKLIYEETSDGFIKEYTYNDKGSLLNKKEYYKANPLLNYYEESKYNDFGQAIEETDGLGNVLKYEYLNNGSNVSRIIDSNDNVINYGYDNLTGNRIVISTNVGDESLHNESVYEKGNLINLRSNSNEYEYIYDGFNKLIQININGNEYVRFEETIDDTQVTIIKTIYNTGNGYVKKYDKDSKLLEFNKFSDGTEIPYMKYEYDDSEQLIKEIDLINQKEKVYSYVDYVLSNVTFDGHSYKEEYDIFGNLIKKSYDNNSYTFGYENDLLKSVEYNNDTIESNSYDKLKRLNKRVDELGVEEYSYLTRNTHTSSLVTKVKREIGTNVDYVKYKYDLLGNIIEIKSKDNHISYEYDGINRLIRENNKTLNKTYIYEYDESGNILCKKIYNYSTNNILENENVIEYNYNKDLLINYDNKELTYDSLNNPLTYGDNVLSFELNRLKRYNDNSFKYNELGHRIEKIEGLNKHSYELDGNRIIKEIIKTYSTFDEIANDNLSLSETIISYIYSSNGIIGFDLTQNGVTKRYFYNKNILGDILEIYDNNKTLVAKYVYDAFGNHEILENVDNIANINPFRYRGYYYDVETGLFWLSSRYYSPELCRFISPDSVDYLEPESINGLNLYAYAKNNPIMYYDPSGHSAILVIGLLVGSFIVGAGASVVSQGLTYGWDEINYWQAGVDGLFALGSTALAMTGIGALASAGIGAVAGWSQYAIGSAFHGEDLTLLGSITSAGLGFIGGAISGAGARNSAKIASSMKLTGKGASAIKAITTASNRYLAGEISMKGLQATTRLWGNVALNAVQDAIAPTIRRLMINGAITIAGVTIGTAAVNYGLSYVY